MSAFVTPSIKGFDTLEVPSFAFLIEHPPSGRKVLFDLGLRKDWENLSPAAVAMAKSLDSRLTNDYPGGVRQLLEAHGVPGASIEAVVWSHWHFDHTGDPSTFDPATALVVGPGFRDALLPGYPADPGSAILESDYAGRELREVRFDGATRVGRFDALDYFGDGSFYLLDGPGHTVGHLCGLARVKSGGGDGGDSYIFLGGDASHQAGEFRPSAYLPLPDAISPNPLREGGVPPCPGALFEHLLRDGDRSKPFFRVAEGGVSLDPPTAEETIAKMQEADAQDKVLVVIAHDKSLLDVVDFFPKYANDFASKDWVGKGRWAFLKDFKEALL